MGETWFQYWSKRLNISSREVSGKIVAVDFDGTITKDNKFPDTIGVVRDGCKEAIDYIRQKNKVILWTCRSGEYLDEAILFLQDNGIEVDGVNGKQHGKLMADIYIDDKNIFCTEVDWAEVKRWFEGE